MVKSKLTWDSKLAFAVEQDDFNFYVDGSPQHGGQDKGPFPKGLMLSALAGCSGMDTVSILEKMRLPEYKLTIEAEAETVTEHPTVFKHVDLSFKFEGEDLPIDKLKRGVELGVTKYCPVYAMLIKAVPIEVKIFLNEEEV